MITTKIIVGGAKMARRYTDFCHYKERHLVECFFVKIKDHRRIAMRFEKLVCRFLAFIHLAATLLWLA